MKRIALKIDVDTCRGTLVGVPALIELLQRHEASGTFFFSLGPTAAVGKRASPRQAVTTISSHASTGCFCRHRISGRGADSMRQARAAGFEVAIHAWHRVRWEKLVLTADNAWVEAEMAQACRRFAAFSAPPQAHAAPGWRMNRHALRLTQRLGFCYASDCRANFPFIPGH
jgi:undecaprenyl phosphate-alpha-L-ara4FN deformylase